MLRMPHQVDGSYQKNASPEYHHEETGTHPNRDSLWNSDSDCKKVSVPWGQKTPPIIWWTKNAADHRATSHCSHLWRYTLRGEGVENQNTGPIQLRCVSKEWFQSAQTSPSSHTQKSSKVINMRPLFFVISSNVLMFHYMVFCFCFLQQKLLYTLVPSKLSERLPSQAIVLSKATW